MGCNVSVCIGILTVAWPCVDIFAHGRWSLFTDVCLLDGVNSFASVAKKPGRRPSRCLTQPVRALANTRAKSFAAKVCLAICPGRFS